MLLEVVETRNSQNVGDRMPVKQVLARQSVCDTAEYIAENRRFEHCYLERGLSVPLGLELAFP